MSGLSEFAILCHVPRALSPLPHPPPSLTTVVLTCCTPRTMDSSSSSSSSSSRRSPTREEEPLSAAAISAADKITRQKSRAGKRKGLTTLDGATEAHANVLTLQEQAIKIERLSEILEALDDSANEKRDVRLKMFVLRLYKETQRTTGWDATNASHSSWTYAKVPRNKKTKKKQNYPESKQDPVLVTAIIVGIQHSGTEIKVKFAPASTRKAGRRDEINGTLFVHVYKSMLDLPAEDPRRLGMPPVHSQEKPLLIEMKFTDMLTLMPELRMISNGIQYGRNVATIATNPSLTIERRYLCVQDGISGILAMCALKACARREQWERHKTMVYPLVSFVEDDFNFMGTIASRENVQELLTNLVGQLKITSSALQTVLQWLVRAEDQVDQIMDVGVYTRGVRRTIEDLYPRIEAIRHSQQAPLSMMEAAEKVISQSGALGLI